MWDHRHEFRAAMMGRIPASEQLSRLLRVFALGLGILVFDAGARTVDAQNSLFELINNRCVVLQDILEEIAADFADPQRRMKRDDQVSQSILDRLAGADTETIEKFFRCFSFEERVVNNRVEIVISIPVAKLNVPTTPEEKEFRQLLMHARLVARKSDDGFKLDGKYAIEY
jgi:hypothetical protein